MHRCMFWIVILHKTVVTRIYFFDEWYKCFIQHVSKYKAIHDAFKHTHSCTSSLTYPGPDMHLHWVFGPA